MKFNVMTYINYPLTTYKRLSPNNDILPEEDGDIVTFLFY